MCSFILLGRVTTCHYNFLIIIILFFILLPNNVASAEEIPIDVFSPYQVKPGRALPIRIVAMNPENNAVSSEENFSNLSSLRENVVLKSVEVLPPTFVSALDNKTQSMVGWEVVREEGVIGLSDEIVQIKIPSDTPAGVLKVPLELVYTEYACQSIEEKHAVETVEVVVTLNPEIRRAIILNVDALKADTLFDYLVYYNNTRQHLIERGISYANATSIFPSITPAAHTAIYTGAYPHRTGITGFRWFA